MAGDAVMAGRVLALAVLASTIGFAPADAGAQSLGDIARKEAERRGTAPAAGKTYTNENLTPDFTKAPAPAEAVPAKPEPGKTADAADEEAAKQKEQEEAEKWGVTPRDQQEPPPPDDLNEEFWRSRAALIKARLAGQNAQIEQLRQRLASFPPATSTEERAIAERTLSRAITDLEHMNAEWVRFEKQARDRKVPEHWIR